MTISNLLNMGGIELSHLVEMNHYTGDHKYSHVNTNFLGNWERNRLIFLNLLTINAPYHEPTE